MKIVTAIVGPTAIGKTNLAFSMARNWPIEVISMDSAQVYIGMNIGTSKPNIIEQQQLVHHLIDIIPPTESFSAAKFISLAKNLITEIWSRGNIPVLVGGTFLYLHSIYYGINAIPNGNPMIRKKIEEEAQEKGWLALHKKLEKVDPQRAAQLNKNDRQRIQRALEIYYATGTKMSEYFQAIEKPLGNTPFWICGLNVNNRQDIQTIIENRFQGMIENGLIDEVKNLLKKYEIHENTPSMRCIGYKQVIQYLKNKQPIEELITSGVIATRQLAKRQLTWLKKTPCDTVLFPYEKQDVDTRFNQELSNFLLKAR
ncbi:tRNA (adenosine(37)-N6)-dimethylallyltransferase MiaA [Candidatus Ichthyocystis hellenicum]|uniref:tRNA (adenosine(37)-N6)-dimethylallyltransferase MiaA n=1 Tax=Candidatus Ichthyocystis hellenicum TaxID=1561003 RepID=UPI000A5EA985|nr:tRNA (adenosine(37)-N6)-dimethylallyltransferase MiaA [Candidatus Ichthyocystis hellenicum]